MNPLSWLRRRRQSARRQCAEKYLAEQARAAHLEDLRDRLAHAERRLAECVPPPWATRAHLHAYNNAQASWEGDCAYFLEEIRKATE
jgi:hypothetical protein